MEEVKEPAENLIQRFLFDDLDIRGAVVRLGSAWRGLLAGRGYPLPLVELLGEMCATTLLLADNLKSPGRLSFQWRGDGPVSLLVIDCDEQFTLRAMAQHHTLPRTAPRQPVEWLRGGQLALLMQSAVMREPHQSIVPLASESLAEGFEHFLAQSEQLTSRFFLAASPENAAGLFLQKMPTADERDPDGWTRAEALAATVKPAELLGLLPERLLERLFHEEKLRVFTPRTVIRQRPKDWENVGNMLRALGREQVYAVLQEQGEIFVRDDLGNHEYRFDRDAVDALFVGIPPTSPTVH